MGDKESLSQAYSFVRLALPLMAQLGVPVTPQNYTVWYHYVSGTNGELSKTIDAMREKKEQFTDENNEALYRQFFSAQDENELARIRDDLKRILVMLVREVAELTGQTEDYESFLSDKVNLLTNEASARDIEMVIGEIVEKTRVLEGYGKHLRHQLAKNTETLETLKKEFDEVKNQAFVDFLTGIPNRKAFQEAITAMTAEALAEQRDLSLLLIDIDHFKRFNDQHGHLIGDEVLRFVAKRIKEIVRGKDMLARFGGEEFVLILPQTAMPGALVVAESIRGFFAQTTLAQVTTSKKLGKITVSIGAACYRKGEQPEELIARADQALYAAKKGGRNRVHKECEGSSNWSEENRSFSDESLTTTP